LFVFNLFPGFKCVLTALSSSPEESHLQALTKPCLKLSPHTAFHGD
jgi:hypothetical protein